MVTGHSSNILSVALSSDGELLASSAVDNSIRLWEVLTGRMLIIMPGSVWQLAFSANGRLLGPSPQSNGDSAILEVLS